MACSKNLRTDFLMMADPLGSWSWLGFSATIGGSYSTGMGTNPGTLTGDDPLVNFEGFISGFYKFEYAPPEDATCGSPVSFIVPVMEQPNPGTSATSSECENSGETIELLSKLGGSPQVGGTWTLISGSPPMGTYNLPAGSFTLGPTVVPGTYVFRYTIPEPSTPGYTTDCADCSAAFADVTINVQDAFMAGSALNISNCN